jgi:hypothetical protein
VREEIVDELEEFVRRGRLWHEEDLSELVARLHTEAEDHGDVVCTLLCTPLNSILLRQRLGAVSADLAGDVEAIIYPRLWKVMEAARDGLPDTEIRTRIEVLNRRLSRVFAEE